MQSVITMRHVYHAKRGLIYQRKAGQYIWHNGVILIEWYVYNIGKVFCFIVILLTQYNEIEGDRREQMGPIW